MEKNNPLYKEQGIHVITTIFTVEKGITKVLLIERKNEPYKGMWALTGGALYNNEDLLDGVKREIKEKTGLEDIDLYFSDVFGDYKRSPVMRMVAITYLGLIDIKRVTVLKDTLKTSNAKWVAINEVPNLAYDHNQIFNSSITSLKDKIMNTDILKSLFPNGFTMPEIQKTCELILGVSFDRRNFRKRLLANELVESTSKTKVFEGTKPAKVYKFKNKDV